MMFYASTYVQATGIILVGCFVIGLYWLIKNRSVLLNIFPLLFGLVYWVILSAVSLHWVCWGLPMYLTPLLVSAFGIDFLLDSLGGLEKRKVLCLGVVGVLLGISAFNLVISSVLRVAYQVTPDTRIASIEYCGENNITTENSIYETYTPLSPANKIEIFKHFKEKNGKYKLENSDGKIEYIVLSAKYNNRFKNAPERYIKENAIYDTVRKDFRLLKSFLGAAGIPQQAVEIKNIHDTIKQIFNIQKQGLAGGAIEIYIVE